MCRHLATETRTLANVKARKSFSAKNLVVWAMIARKPQKLGVYLTCNTPPGSHTHASGPLLQGVIGSPGATV
jgi:hypothetical protein